MCASCPFSHHGPLKSPGSSVPLCVLQEALPGCTGLCAHAGMRAISCFLRSLVPNHRAMDAPRHPHSPSRNCPLSPGHCLTSDPSRAGPCQLRPQAPLSLCLPAPGEMGHPCPETLFSDCSQASVSPVPVSSSSRMRPPGWAEGPGKSLRGAGCLPPAPAPPTMLPALGGIPAEHRAWGALSPSAGGIRLFPVPQCLPTSAQNCPWVTMALQSHITPGPEGPSGPTRW